MRQESSRGARSPGRRLQSPHRRVWTQSGLTFCPLSARLLHFRPAERPGPCKLPCCPGRAVLRGALPLQRAGLGLDSRLGAAPAPLQERGPHSGLRAPGSRDPRPCVLGGGRWAGSQEGTLGRADVQRIGVDAPRAEPPAPPPHRLPPGHLAPSAPGRAGPPAPLCPRSLSLSSLASPDQAPRTLRGGIQGKHGLARWSGQQGVSSAGAWASLLTPEPAPRHAHTVPCAPLSPAGTCQPPWAQALQPSPASEQLVTAPPPQEESSAPSSPGGKRTLEPLSGLGALLMGGSALSVSDTGCGNSESTAQPLLWAAQSSGVSGCRHSLSTSQELWGAQQRTSHRSGASRSDLPAPKMIKAVVGLSSHRKP